MIQLLEKGKYVLFETSESTKILVLEDLGNFAWIKAGRIGDILVSTDDKAVEKTILAQGNYRLYDVANEPKLTDLKHLELFVGDGVWQGYLLPTTLPDRNKKRSRIIATDEIITINAG